MERTLGFDFGTHQTKICVEEKEGANVAYHFFPFRDVDNNISFTLPSVVRINKDRTLSYGLLDNQEGQIIRYFKQASYCTEDFRWSNEIRADYFSIWYIAYILFLIENEFDTNFATQMGVPTDTANLDINKRRAVCLMLSAIRLVEDVFHNDLEGFLSCELGDLFTKTKILDYSPQLKEEFQIYVFPEAYACLRPLTTRGRIATGMSLMVDIGGGTTDISFFTLANKTAQIYKFISIPRGLNFLTGVDGEDSAKVNNSKVMNSSELISSRVSSFESILHRRLSGLQKTLEIMFENTCDLRIERLLTALRNRPIVYCGGGSTFDILCKGYIGFTEVRRVSNTEWNLSCFPSFDAYDLCPILNTAYGLSISATSDQIDITPLKTLFDGIKDAQEEAPLIIDKRTNSSRYIGQKDFIDRWNEINVGSGSGTRKCVKSRSKKTIEERIKGFDNLIKSIRNKRTFGVCKTPQDVDKFLSFYYSVVSPIGERFIEACASYITDNDELRDEFLTRCYEWNKECAIILEQRKKDVELAIAISKKKIIYTPVQPRIKRDRIKKHIPIPKRPEVTYAPKVGFVKGDKISFIDTTGYGVVQKVNKENMTLLVQTGEGFVIEVPISNCVKTNDVDMYFKQDNLQSTQNIVCTQKQEVKKKEPASKINKQMEAGLNALLEKYNRKK